MCMQQSVSWPKVIVGFFEWGRRYHTNTRKTGIMSITLMHFTGDVTMVDTAGNITNFTLLALLPQEGYSTRPPYNSTRPLPYNSKCISISL